VRKLLFVILSLPCYLTRYTALLKLIYIALVLKEVLALLLIAVVVLEAVEEDLQYYIVASFNRIEKK
jgi:hypothetical protein